MSSILITGFPILCLFHPLQPASHQGERYSLAVGHSQIKPTRALAAKIETDMAAGHSSLRMVSQTYGHLVSKVQMPDYQS